MIIIITKIIIIYNCDENGKQKIKEKGYKSNVKDDYHNF